MAEIKFCGMTRAEDVRAAGALGARYVGVIFTESPRRITDTQAPAILDAAPPETVRVGVFGSATPVQVAGIAVSADVDVAQLHGDPDVALVQKLRRAWEGQIWAAVRVAGDSLPDGAAELFDVADAVVLDARAQGKLGGTGIALPWDRLRAVIAPLRGRRAKLVVAGGLNPANVAHAIDALDPDIVDVSSGVEASPGIKDAAKMRAFRDAVAGVRT